MTALKVELQSDALKGHTESFTLRQAGVQFNADFREAIARLSEGSLWDQVLYRRNFQLEWHISTDWDRDVLKERFSEEWQRNASGNPSMRYGAYPR